MDNWQNIGLTKREYYAGLAMSGMLASYHTSTPESNLIAERAVQYADALINELNKNTNG